uniref:Uncharacterized protein n=2 Tax=Nyssomyia neivai TaxID=330878 RepID=A0A1L8D6Z7_9DIPT
MCFSEMNYFLFFSVVLGIFVKCNYFYKYFSCMFAPSLCNFSLYNFFFIVFSLSRVFFFGKKKWVKIFCISFIVPVLKKKKSFSCNILH